MDKDQMGELRELVEFLKENGVAEFDMERADLKVRLKFAGATATGSAAGVQLPATVESAAALPAVGAAVTHATAFPVAASELLHEVKSPLVGTFYESASPGAAPFVKAGDHVEVGQVLCIVEAMKLMNEVEADVAGELVERIAVSGQPVEYGQALFSIRPR